MKLFKAGSWWVLGALAFGGCGQDSNSTSAVEVSCQLPNGNSLTAPVGDNVMPITVNGSKCSVGNQYLNEPCVSVTVCTPGTSSGASCQTIDNILLDTGSYGLRIFSSVLTVPLTQVTDGASNPVAECALFGTGSDWGPVKIANVILGNEPAVAVPIQVIDKSFSAPFLPNDCADADEGPTDAKFNGILGVGLFAEDCGSWCASVTNNSVYYSCSGGSCSSTALPVVKQVTNPVSALPVDHNGVIVQLPSIPSSGAKDVTGYLVLGIDTRSNNVSDGVTALPADGWGDIQTEFNGRSYSSFIDSGSNGLFFSTTSLSSCSSPNDEWYCPSPAQKLTATNLDSTGAVRSNVCFVVDHLIDILSSSDNMAFSGIAGDLGGSEFDWGLPFYFGRNVFVGIENKTSKLGAGPYFAY